MRSESQKLSVVEKAGYSLGDCAANFVFQTQIMFLMGFYTDVLGIAASTAGWIFLLSRFWDAFNDPIMGALADRTKSRWGKFRPWILLTAVPFAVFFVLAYTAPELSRTGRVIWAVLTYNLLMMIYTANNIPYSALTGVMTSDMRERASLVTWRFFFAMVAQFLVQTFTLTLVARFGGDDVATGFQYTMTMWAVIAVVFFVITFLTVRERVAPDPQQKTSFGRDILDLCQNRNWVMLAGATVFIFICLAMRGGTTYYYFQYYVQGDDLLEAVAGWKAAIGETNMLGKVLDYVLPTNWQGLFGWFNGLGTLVTIIGVVLSKPLVVRFGKRDVYCTCLFLTALCTLAFVSIPPAEVEVMFAVQMAWQFIYGITIPVLWAMIADVADFSEWTTGRRATAMTFAASLFALKLGLSFGQGLQGWILDFYGYAPNVVQEARSLDGIRWLMSVYPAIAFFIAVGFLMFYKINKPMEDEMQRELEARRNARQGI